MLPTLDEATSKQLVDELFNRFDSACFVGTRNVSDSIGAFQVGHLGPDEHAIGLLRSYALKLETRIAQGWEDASPLDDGETDWMDGD